MVSARFPFFRIKKFSKIREKGFESSTKVLPSTFSSPPRKMVTCAAQFSVVEMGGCSVTDNFFAVTQKFPRPRLAASLLLGIRSVFRIPPSLAMVNRLDCLKAVPHEPLRAVSGSNFSRPSPARLNEYILACQLDASRAYRDILYIYYLIICGIKTFRNYIKIELFGFLRTQMPPP